MLTQQDSEALNRRLGHPSHARLHLNEIVAIKNFFERQPLKKKQQQDHQQQ
jgi:hypothetical protein